MIAQITKVSVKETLPKQWAVMLNLKLMDGATELFSQDFSEDYKTGGDIKETVSRFKVKMQEAIDKHKSEQDILNHPKLDSAITALQNGLIV